MLQLVRKILLVICALAFVAAPTISFSPAAASAGAPCTHEPATGTESHHASAPSSHNDHHGAACLACCLGACTALPGLPPRVTVGSAAFTATPIAYWEGANTLASRSIAPDLGPPRRWI
ncbi:MAG: hypothetical protein J0H67_10735 [Rhodospirillales bacterium]|nr:hypothetical protein [Rhodospirillales bacterium]MBN8897146.1 hypothetical protein [Rhodospirillales bacterium]